MRRLLPWAIGVPLIGGWLVLLGADAGLFRPEVGTAVLVLASVVLLAGGVVWTVHSVSVLEERAAAELAERRAAEERFRVAVEACPSGMIMVDERGLIVLANTEMQRLFGYSERELLGRPVEDLVPTRLREEHRGRRAAFGAAPVSRPMGEGRELFGLRRDGTEFPLEIGLNPVPTPEGAFTLASIIDITERKRRDDELKRSNAELEQFAHVASHDLQEPLRMVASYTRLLKQKYAGSLDEKAEKYIDYAADGAIRMQRLVADLLAYSRVGSQGKQLAEVDSRVVLEGVLEGLRGAVDEAGASIVVPQRLPTVMADGSQLRQVFQNLIGNALKFRADRAPRIVIEARPRGDGWQFSVADNGIGIEPRFHDRVFQMFQRLHEIGRYEGSGIGLSIAKRIVERHGGTIWVESTPGEGTTFHFTLPGPDSGGSRAGGA